MRRAERFAQLLALIQVADECIGQKHLGLTVAVPLKLVVAARHVLDQVLHPEQRVPPISHDKVLLHATCPESGKRSSRSASLAELL
jgi:hypothetical protein